MKFVGIFFIMYCVSVSTAPAMFSPQEPDLTVTSEDVPGFVVNLHRIDRKQFLASLSKVNTNQVVASMEYSYNLATSRAFVENIEVVAADQNDACDMYVVSLLRIFCSHLTMLKGQQEVIMTIDVAWLGLPIAEEFKELGFSIIQDSYSFGLVDLKAFLPLVVERSGFLERVSLFFSNLVGGFSS